MFPYFMNFLWALTWFWFFQDYGQKWVKMLKINDFCNFWVKNGGKNVIPMFKTSQNHVIHGLTYFYDFS